MAERTISDPASERTFLAAICWLSTTDAGRALSTLETSLVTPERMADPAHAAVLVAVRQCLEVGRPCDAATLGPALSGSSAVDNAGGLVWLSELLSSEGYEHQIQPAADSIRAMALRRALVAIGRDLTGRSGDLRQDPVAALQTAVQALSGITLTKRTVRTLSEVLGDVVDEWEEVQLGKKRVVPTGFPGLDAAIGGWQPTLNLIGAMPGVGKSAILASTTQQMARAGRKVGVFSLEDDARWLGWRLLSDESGINQFFLRNKGLTNGERESVTHGVSRIVRYADRVLIDDRSGLSPAEVVQTARDMIVNRGCEAVIVDHLGELRFEGGHGERYDLELMEGLSDLREIAKRYRVPVIVAAHLRRRQGLSQADAPSLTDFANSSAIERQARVALGLSRAPDSDTLSVHVLKQTNGRAGISVDLQFRGAAAMVRDCEGATQSWYEAQEAQP